MNDFFIASNRSVKVGDLSVHQLQMHNFDEWSGAAQAIKEFLNNHSDGVYKKLLTEHTNEVVTLLCKSTLQDEAELISIAENSELTLLQLVDAVIKVNSAFFTEKELKHRDDVDPRKKNSWLDTFQLLVSNGHSHESIMQMSYGSFRYYLKAAQKAERMKMRSQAIANRAQHAINKKFDDFIKSLEKDR